MQQKIMDIKAPKQWRRKQMLKQNRRRVNKFFSNLTTRGGVMDNRAILFVYDKVAPELSYIISEDL